MTKFTTRELVTLAVFGTLWGTVEISLGSLLHALRVPFSGAVLAAAGLTIVLMGRLFVGRPGSTFFIGVVAMILKLFSLGSVIVGPMVGILAEAALAETVLSLSGRPGRVRFMLAGSLGILWTVIQPFITGLLLFGRELYIVWLDFIDAGSRLLGLDSSLAAWILISLLLLHLALGAAAGRLAWEAGHALQNRLGRAAVITQQ
jgi:hypothetical protein